MRTAARSTPQQMLEDYRRQQAQLQQTQMERVQALAVEQAAEAQRVTQELAQRARMARERANRVIEEQGRLEGETREAEAKTEAEAGEAPDPLEAAVSAWANPVATGDDEESEFAAPPTPAVPAPSPHSLMLVAALRRAEAIEEVHEDEEDEEQGKEKEEENRDEVQRMDWRRARPGGMDLLAMATAAQEDLSAPAGS